MLKVSTRREIINIRAEINQIEDKNRKKKQTKLRVVVLKKINKLLARLIKKGEKTQISKIRGER